ncbi:MAG: hypothetical protein CMJ58_15180 [Planctomycetaceae bacterium]|nr:hypothetical protein [Planctomycetaceae bacterium]
MHGPSLFPEFTPAEPLLVRILRHVHRYKVTLPAAVARLLYPADASGQAIAREEIAGALARLVADGRLVQLPGDSELARHLYVQPGHDVKWTDVARLWWCCLDDIVRHLVAYSELKPVYAAERIPPPFHNYSHAVCEADGGPVLTRIYQCQAARKNAREQIRRHLTQNSKAFSSWLEDGSYRLAVLVPSAQRKQEIEQVVHESFRAGPPLAELAGITVSVVPTEETFAAMYAAYVQGARDG